MTIKELINKHLDEGLSLKDAQNVTAEEIILNKIASSDLTEKVTLKGGIVMYNLTKNNRRVTQDIDFDLIRYSIDEKAINLFIDKLNTINDGFMVSISGRIEPLHQEDYQGVRVHTIITDKVKDKLRLKLDIGVHTYLAIEQNAILFSTKPNKNGIFLMANPPEQIFAEKLISLARLGPISTRYKDLYDFYYLINSCNISLTKVREILKMFFFHSKKKPNSFIELQNVLEETLTNKNFIKEASKPASNWLEVDIDMVISAILNFVNK